MAENLSISQNQNLADSIYTYSQMPLSLAAASVDSHKGYLYSKRLMNYQNQLNLENWERTNEYNSPKSVMARYRAAGLNPNLIYGNGTMSPAALPAQPSGGNVRSNMQGAISQGLSAYMSKAQIDNLRVQNENLQQDTRIKAQQAEGAKLDNFAKVMRMPGIPYELRKIAADAVASEVGAKWSDPLASLDYALSSGSIKKQNEEVKQLQEYIKVLSAEEKVKLADAALKEVTQRLEESNIRVNNELAKKIIQETFNAAQQGKLLSYRVGLMELGIDPDMDPNIRFLINTISDTLGLGIKDIGNIITSNPLGGAFWIKHGTTILKHWRELPSPLTPLRYGYNVVTYPLRKLFGLKYWK